MARLGKCYFGAGDRFGKEGKAQLRTVLKIQEKGIEMIPVWNKNK